MERFVPPPTYSVAAATLQRSSHSYRWSMEPRDSTDNGIPYSITATLEREFRSHNNFAIMHCVALVYDAASFGVTHL